MCSSIYSNRTVNIFFMLIHMSIFIIKVIILTITMQCHIMGNFEAKILGVNYCSLIGCIIVRIKFQGLTIIAFVHCNKILRISYFLRQQQYSEIHENSEICCPRKPPAAACTYSNSAFILIMIYSGYTIIFFLM